MYEADNALRRNVALLCCSFQSFLKIFLIPKAFAVFFFSGAAKPRFFVPSQFVSRSAQPLDPLRGNIVFYTARYLINERGKSLCRLGRSWHSLRLRERPPKGVISLFTNFMSQFRIGVYTFFVVKLVSIYESGIYKTIFLMAVIRK